MDQQQRLGVLSDVKGQIAELENELAELRRLESFLSRPSYLKAPSANGPTGQSTADTTNDAAHRFQTVSSIAAAVVQILREAGRRRPMRSGDIAAKLIAGGYPWNGTDERAFANTVFSAMARRPELFTKPERGLWTLTEFEEDET